MSKNTTKKLLILTTYFPPAAEIAAARLIGIIKYLLRLGWEIHVITDVDRDFDYSKDEILGKIKIYAASKSAHITTGTAFAPGKSLKDIAYRIPLHSDIIKKVKSARNLLKYKRWGDKAYSLALEVIEKHQISTLLATVPRIETLFIGGRIKKKIPSVKLFCEYRDIITGNAIYKSIHSRSENFFAEQMEKKSIHFVDNFIYLTEGIQSRYLLYKGQNSAVSEGVVLTNGYDGEMWQASESGRNTTGKLVINHIGHFYGSRSAILFCAAFAQLSQENPQITDNISLNFIGKMDQDDRGEIERICTEYKLSNITLTGPVGHDKAIHMMEASDVNLIITHQHGSEYALPGKLFEYMGVGKPILAVTADPLLKQLIINEKLGWVCPNDRDNIKSILALIYRKWVQGDLNCSIHRSTNYETGHIVGRLDKFLTES